MDEAARRPEGREKDVEFGPLHELGAKGEEMRRLVCLCRTGIWPSKPYMCAREPKWMGQGRTRVGSLWQ